MYRNITHPASQPVISTFFCHTCSFIWVLGTAQWESWDWRFGSGDHFFPFLPYHFLNKKVPFFIWKIFSAIQKCWKKIILNTSIQQLLRFHLICSLFHTVILTHTFTCYHTCIHAQTHMQNHTHTHTYNIQSHTSFSEPSECERQALDTNYIFEHFLRTI